MILIATVDDRGGMTFNKRRQSQDHILNEHIIEISKNTRLWMNAYTYELFTENEVQKNIIVDENFLAKAQAGDFCFVENENVEAYSKFIEKIILFKWNRTYPGEAFFNIDLNDWKLLKSEEFCGSSHEKITMEIYSK